MSTYDGSGAGTEATTVVGVHGAGEQRETAYEVATTTPGSQLSATLPRSTSASKAVGAAGASPRAMTGADAPDTGEVPNRLVAVTVKE